MADDKTEVKITESVILIRIAQLYRDTMRGIELYDATRGVWRVALENAQKAKYAFAVHDGIVQEVYQITHWFPAGTTLSTRNPEDLAAKDRFEFVGNLAEKEIREKYRLKSVRHLLPAQGGANPITYVNC